MGANANGFSIWHKPVASLSGGAPATRLPRRQSRGWKSLAGFFGAWLVLGAVWEAGARLGVLNASILPPPSQFIPSDGETLWKRAKTRALHVSPEQGPGPFDASQFLVEGFRSANNFH